MDRPPSRHTHPKSWLIDTTTWILCSSYLAAIPRFSTRYVMITPTHVEHTHRAAMRDLDWHHQFCQSRLSMANVKVAPKNVNALSPKEWREAWSTILLYSVSHRETLVEGRRTPSSRTKPLTMHPSQMPAHPTPEKCMMETYCFIISQTGPAVAFPRSSPTV